MALVGLYSRQGTLERPIASSGWLIPSDMWLEGNTLRYQVGKKGGWVACRCVQASSGLLETFVRLSDATPERILLFAKRYGMLGVKKPRDRPKTDSQFVLDRRFAIAYGYSILEAHEGNVGGGETIRNWWFWAHKFAAALRIGSCLSQRLYGDVADWQTLFGGSNGPKERDFKPSQGVTEDDIFLEARASFYDQLESWLALGAVRLELNGWDNCLYLATPTLFSGLILQLVSAIAGTDGFAICSACHKPYAPSRRPTSNKRNYCNDCGRQAAVRDAVRAFRRRDGRKLFLGSQEAPRRPQKITANRLLK
jgi:hypothetical protein